MPSSSNKGKLFTAYILQQVSLKYPLEEFLDIGCGMGTYPRLYSGLFENSTWVGIEGWGPYFKEYQLERYYQGLICADARWVDLSRLGNFDACFCGDILEHMSVAEAVDLVHRLSLKSKIISVSVPVYHCPQDEVFGNFFEVHVEEDWTMEMLEKTFQFTAGTIKCEEMGISFISRYPHVNAALKEAIAKAEKVRGQLDEIEKNIPPYFWQDPPLVADIIKKLPQTVKA